MAIIRWDPFRDIITLREKMNRLFEDAVTARGEEKDMISSTWAPSVDIYETESSLILTAEVPGIEEDNIEIKIEDNTLSLSGERKFEKETKYSIHSETSYIPGPSRNCAQINKQIRVDTKLLWQRSCIFIPSALPIGSLFGVNATTSKPKE